MIERTEDEDLTDRLKDRIAQLEAALAEKEARIGELQAIICQAEPVMPPEKGGPCEPVWRDLYLARQGLFALHEILEVADHELIREKARDLIARSREQEAALAAAHEALKTIAARQPVKPERPDTSRGALSVAWQLGRVAAAALSAPALQSVAESRK